MSKPFRWLPALVVLLLMAVGQAAPAGAAVTVQRAELNDGRLRLVGSATANRDITVDGVAMGRSDGSGSFRIERSPYTPPADCTVDVNDGSSTARTATLSGCSVTTTTTTMTVAPSTTTTTASPPPPPPSSGFRIITESPLHNANVGAEYTAFIEACCGSGTPYRWRLVGGSVPAGLRFVGDDFRLSRTTGVVGTPTRVQTTTFTVEARDGAGATARKSFSITVDPALPLEITNQGSVLAPGTVGQSYATSLFASGGVRPWTWSIIGSLPPGLTLSGNTISGTPTTAGTYPFTARVRSADGQQAERTFTISVSPRA